jgi:hypothetical protein
MPVRSPRQIYKITSIQYNVDEAPGTDAAPAQTEAGQKRPIYVLMKESIGDYLGLTPLAWNAAELTGTFAGSGLNQGAKYRKRVGGYRDGSYTLVAKTTFTIKEIVKGDNGSYTTRDKNFKSISIGFPKGHSVHEVLDFLATTTKFAQVRAVITPQGRRVSIGAVT